MINEPAIDQLIDKLGDKYKGSKYVLCVVAAKRARQLALFNYIKSSMVV